MAFDLRWKAALGLEVHDLAVAQSTLVEFRARVQLHGTMERAFGRLTQGLVEAGIVRPDEVQVLDSTAIWGRGAVGHVQPDRQRGAQASWGVGTTSWRTAEELAVELGLVMTAPTEAGSLKGRAGIDWEDEEQRRAFFNQIVQEARRMLGAVSDDELADGEVAEAAAVLRRILLQDLEPVGVEADEEDLQGSGDAGDQAVLALDTETETQLTSSVCLTV